MNRSGSLKQDESLGTECLNSAVGNAGMSLYVIHNDSAKIGMLFVRFKSEMLYPKL